MEPNRASLTALLVFTALLLNYLPASNARAATDPWRAPLGEPILVHEFLQPSADWAVGHRGVDYLVENDQPVFAAHSGRVAFAGRVVNRSVLSIRHDNGLFSTVEPVCSSLQRGQVVHTGDLVGTTCFTPEYQSHCGARTCLHFGMKNSDGYLSPLLMIGGLSPSRLKPLDGQIRSSL